MSDTDSDPDNSDPSQPRLAMSRPTGPETTTVTLPRSRVALLFVLMLVTAAGNTAMQSVMPSIGTALKVDDVWISLAYTWSALLWMLCAPMWARRSDRRGRKAMMGIGLLGFISSFTLCGLALWLGLNGWLGPVATLLLFAVCRSLYGGFGSAAPPAVQAYVASRTSRAERTESLSLIASSFGLGTVVGPALAPFLILPALGLVSPFFGFALFAVVVLILLRLHLPDDTPGFAARGDIIAAPFSANSDTRIAAGPGDESGPDAVPETAPDAVVQTLRWRDPRLRPWLLAGLLGGHAQAAFMGIVGFLVLDRLALRGDPLLGAGPTGLVLMSGAIATLLAQWGIIPRWHLGPRACCIWGMIVAAAGVGMLWTAHDLHAITISVSLASLGFGLFRPGFTAGASLAVRRSEQGQSAGIVAAVNGAAYIVAPAIGVWLYGHNPWVGFTAILVLCLSVVAIAARGMARDEVMTGNR